MGCRPCGPRFFDALGFPFFPPLRWVLLGKTAYVRPSVRRGLRSTSDGEKLGFKTSVVGLASQKWEVEGDWPLGIGIGDVTLMWRIDHPTPLCERRSPNVDGLNPQPKADGRRER